MTEERYSPRKTEETTAAPYYEQLIIYKTNDITDEIASCEWNGERYDVEYRESGKVYEFKKESIELLELSSDLDPETVIFRADGNVINNIQRILCYGEPTEFYRVVDEEGIEKSYAESSVEISANCLVEESSKRRFQYFQELAKVISIKNKNEDEEHKILENQYDRTEKVDETTVLSKYLSGDPPLKYDIDKSSFIYPFSINKSQKEAVEKAFSSQVSIIQGPPGTGKTQTILNIIANAVLNHKTLAVVSNNNSAVINVKEKLEDRGLGFLSAYLGNQRNREAFFANQSEEYPDMSDWGAEEQSRQSIEREIRDLIHQLDVLLTYENRIAELQQEIYAFELEYSHFQKQTGGKPITADKENESEELTSQGAMSLWLDLEYNYGKPFKLLRKLLMWFHYGKLGKLLSGLPLRYAIPYVQKIYYNKKRRELLAEKNSLEGYLSDYDFREKFKELNLLSMQLLKDSLTDKYSRKSARPIFDRNDLWKKSKQFNEEYPIVLSTTYSIKKSLSYDHIYDYLIIDEATQVDLAAAVLAFSCAANVIIVGDTKQLSNIVDSEKKYKAKKIGKSRAIEEQYEYTEKNILTSVAAIWKDIPNVLLREHYRCNPIIASFFNKKFYDGELINMRTDYDKKDALMLYHTIPGNHARKHLNQRQIDVIRQEVLPELQRRGYKDIGIIAPYNDQVDALRKEIDDSIEIDTVHKFQGREKDAIILTSVDNKIGEFVNDASLFNVAVSRAKESLTVIVSNDRENESTNYGDLEKYLEYNGLQTVESRVTSVFDLLYKQYEAERKEYLKKRKRRLSEHPSEELVYSVIEKILDEPGFSGVGCHMHASLYSLIKDDTVLDEEERKYAFNMNTHVDFLFHDKMSNRNLAALEIDGTSYHRKGSRQAERDKIKDSILDKCSIPRLRIRTDESGEEARIRQLLKESL